jgi:hypothetical protein
MFDQLSHFFQGAGNFLQSVGSFLGVAFGLSVFFPKIGDALLGRMLTGSIEKQKAFYSREIESHKLVLSTQLEEYKKDLAVQMEAEKQRMNLYFSEQKRKSDIHQRLVDEIRLRASEIIEESDSSQDSKYEKTSIFLHRISTYPSSLRQVFQSHLDQIGDLIEAPLSLMEDSFCDDVDALLFSLMEQIDKMEN